MRKTGISVISFTDNGEILAGRIKKSMPEEDVELCRRPPEGVTAWAGGRMKGKRALIFVGACGIAVRAISPFIEDKLTDSPVLVMDERGRYVIPVLSGHVGGANELAVILAGKLGVEPVITTATDLNGIFAADLFAEENGLRIVHKAGIAKVSAKALRGEQITVAIENNETGMLRQMPEGPEWVSYPPAEDVDILISATGEYAGKAVLWLKPKEYYIGIGCKKGKTKEEIDTHIRAGLVKAGIEAADIAGIASIERKKEEPGICEWAMQNRIPFFTYTEAELNALEGVFHGSGFVMAAVGTDNVCERAARKAAGEGSILVLEKQAAEGITIAIAKRGR